MDARRIRICTTTFLSTVHFAYFRRWPAVIVNSRMSGRKFRSRRGTRDGKTERKLQERGLNGEKAVEERLYKLVPRMNFTPLHASSMWHHMATPDTSFKGTTNDVWSSHCGCHLHRILPFYINCYRFHYHFYYPIPSKHHYTMLFLLRRLLSSLSCDAITYTCCLKCFQWWDL